VVAELSSVDPLFFFPVLFLADDLIDDLWLCNGLVVGLKELVAKLSAAKNESHLALISSSILEDSIC